MRTGDLYIKGAFKLEFYETNTLTVDLGALSENYSVFIYTGTTAEAGAPDGFELPAVGGTNVGRLLFYKNKSTNGSRHKIRGPNDATVIMSSKGHPVKYNVEMPAGDAVMTWSDGTYWNHIQWYAPPL